MLNFVMYILQFKEEKKKKLVQGPTALSDRRTRIRIHRFWIQKCPFNHCALQII